MARDANGNYTLPAGNPVAAGTVISTTWANPTLTDIAQALTDSLSRNGDGGMLVAFENVAGNVALPGITWALEPATGLYREATNDMQAGVAGSRVTRWFNDTATPNGEQNPFQIWDGLVWRDALRDNHFDPINFQGDVTVGGTLGVTGAATFSSTVSGAFNGTLGATTPAAVTTTALVATTADINAGTIDGTTIGATTPASVAATTLTTTGTGTNTVHLTGAGSQDLYTYSDGGGIGWATGTGGSYGEMMYLSDASNDVSFYTAGSLRGKFNSTGLAVTGALTTTGAATFSGDVTVNSHLEVQTGGVGETASFGGDDASGARALQIIASTTTGLGDTHTLNATSSTGVIQFATQGLTRATITSAGNVGIGISNPSDYYANFNSLVLGNTSAASGMTIASGTTHDGTLAFADGTSGTAEYSGYIQYSHGTDSLSVGTAATERLRIDASGNLGLGVTPSAWFHVYKGVSFPRGSSIVGRTDDPSLEFVVNGFRDASATWRYIESDFATLQASNSDAHLWYNAVSGTAGGVLTWTPRMILNSSGTLCVGVSGPSNSSSKIAIGLPTGSVAIETRPSNGNGYYGAIFYAQSGIASGYISVSTSSTSFSTTSDYRLKEDAVPMTGATERVKALRPINFAWKADGSRVDGFLAHEAQEVVPEAVHGTKDAMRDEEYEVTPAVEEVRDEDGNITTEAVAAVMGTRSVPDYQGIDQSKLVPLLTATIQELIARIEALEGA